MMKLVVVQLNFEIKFPNLYVGIKCSETRPGTRVVAHGMYSVDGISE